MGTGIRRPIRPAAALLLVLFLLPAPVKGEEGPIVLMVPLIVSPGSVGWAVPLVDGILQDKIRLLSGIRQAEGEAWKEALRELSQAAQIGANELTEATGKVGADFAVVGQFLLDEEAINIDLRLFSAVDQRQIASFQKPAAAAELFTVLSEGALFVAGGTGVEVSPKEKALLEFFPTRSLHSYRAYRAARAEKDPERYLPLLMEAVESDPDYYDANLRIALELYRQGRGEEAVPYMEKAASAGVDVPETHNNLAVIYADLGRKKEAIKEFKKALDLRPDYREARLNFGRVLEENGSYGKAEKEYLMLLDEDPDNVKARSSLALLYERTDRTEQAIQEFRLLSRNTPELAEEYFLKRGRKARMDQDFDKAEKFFLRTVDINPKFALGYAELGTNSYLKENYEKSMEYFRQAIALAPQKAEYHHYLGLAMEKRGLGDEAKQAFQRSAELGGPLETRISLARTHFEAGDLTKAIQELNRVLSEAPSHAEAQALLARAMERAESDQRRAEDRSEFATHRLERLEAIINDLTRTNRDQENRLLSLQTDRQEMEEELVQLREEKEGREKAVGERMERALKSIEDLTASEELEKLRENYESQVESLREERDAALEAAHAAKEQALPPGAAQEEKRRKEAAARGEDLAPLKSERTSWSRERASAREKEKERDRQIATLREELAALKSENEVWRKELDNSREKGEKGSWEAASLRKDLAALKSEKKTWQKERASWKEKGEARDREIADLREDLASLKSEKKSWKSRLASEKQRGDDFSREVNLAREDQGRIRKELDALQVETKEQREALARLEKENSELSGRVKALDSDLGETERSKGELEAIRTQVENDLEKARHRVESSRVATDEMRDRLAAMELESYQRVEEARKKTESEISVREELLAGYRAKEKEALLEKERLLQSVADLEGRLAAEVEARRLSGRGEAQFQESLRRMRLELAQQSLELGRINLRNRDWDKSRLYFQKVLEMDPRNQEAFYGLGEIYFQLGRFGLSKEMYQKAKGP